MGTSYGIVAILLALLTIGPGDSTLLLPLRDVCKFGGKVSYYIGINEARVSIANDLTAAYPPNVDCTLHISESGVNAGVQMSFIAFDMAPKDSSGTCQDYIELMKVDPADGKTKTILSKTCGSTAPVNMTERVNEVILKTKTSAIQSTHTGYVLLFKRFDQAIDPAATPTEAPADTALIAGAVVGAVLVVGLLVLLAFCIFCVFRHKRDLLRRKKSPDRFSNYMRAANPPPLAGPSGLRRTAPPPNNDWRGYVRQTAYTQY